MAETAAPPPTAVDPWGSLRQLVGAVLGPLPGIPAPPLLDDEAADPGLFGPGSATWTVAREPCLLLGGGRALLMQVAHPLVAQAVVDHSDYAVDPFGRLARTVRWLVAVTFGTTAEARQASAAVSAVHRHVRGRLAAENAAPGLPRGTGYDAADPELGRWVHATIVQSMLVTHDALVGGLPAITRDALVREWDAVARLLGMRDGAGFRDAAGLDDFVARTAATLGAPSPATRTAGAVVLHPPLPSPVLRPPFALVGHLTVGLLPAPLRASFGVDWSPRRDRLHVRAHATTRALQRGLPRRLRVSPLHDAALGRAHGLGLPADRDDLREARRLARSLE